MTVRYLARHVSRRASARATGSWRLETYTENEKYEDEQMIIISDNEDQESKT